MTTFIQSPDGIRLAYDVEGSGPALVFLHGLGTNRSIWHEAGWTSRLADRFTVITLDLRGHGETDQPTDPSAYFIDRFREDILTVLEACGAKSFLLYGWSMGATIGLQLAALDLPLERAVIAGTSFGPLFREEDFRPMIDRWTNVLEAQKQGTFDEAILTEQQRVFLHSTNIASRIALWQGLLTWPVLCPADMRHPILIYTGTNDHALERLTAYQEALKQEGIPLHIFAGLDHGQLLDAIDTVLPVVRPFLLQVNE